MLKSISQGVSKFFTNERIVVLVIFLILVWGLLAYSGSKNKRVDTFGVSDIFGSSTPSSSSEFSSSEFSGPMNMSTPATNSMEDNNVASYYGTMQEDATPVTSTPMASVANPSDLLPNDQNSQWSALNPNTMNQGDVLMPDLLQAGYHIGLDTIGQTLRNANLQYRSDPIIPKANIGPWNQSTIEPDLGRVPLELGQGSQ
jgi:hypothetical protein